MTEAAQRYLHIVKHIVKNNHGQIDEGERANLDRQRHLLQLSPAEAQTIEQQVLRAYRKFLEQSQSSHRPGSTVPPATPASSQDGDYLRRRDRYQQEFVQAYRLSHPLNPYHRQELQKLQQALRLSDEEIQQVEAAAIQEFQDIQEVQQAKQRWYYEEFVQAIEADRISDNATRDQLGHLQRELGLNTDEVWQIEQQAYYAKLNDDPNSPPPGDLPITYPPTTHPPITHPPIIGSPSQGDNELDDTQLPDFNGNESLAPTELQTNRGAPSARSLTATLPSYYNGLVSALKARQWQEADRETLFVLLKVANREAQDWLDVDSIERLPCHELHRLDRLWGEHSNEQFSFRIQWRHYNGLTLPQRSSFLLHDTTYERALEFSKQMQWWRSGAEFYKYYHQLTFSLDAPDGHLPARWFWRLPWWRAIRFGGIGSDRGGTSIDAQTLSVFMDKLEKCEII